MDIGNAVSDIIIPTFRGGTMGFITLLHNELKRNATASAYVNMGANRTYLAIRMWQVGEQAYTRAYLHIEL
jgi:hypothetical protein